MEKVKKVQDIYKEAEEKSCPVQQALYYIDEFLKGPMCGRCFPCAFGAYEARIRLQGIVDGQGKREDIDALKRIAEDMLISSFCKKGKDTAEFMLHWLESDVFEKHIEGICPTGTCHAYIRYEIIPDKCTACGECKVVCKDHAIFGEKRKHKFATGYLPFEIRDKRCTRCGECIKVCPEDAIIVVHKKTGEPVEGLSKETVKA